MSRPRGSPDVAIGVVLVVVGGATFSILPLLTAGAAETLGFSIRQVGIMSLAISIGSGAGALAAALSIRSVHWPRAAALALAGMLAANLAAILLHQYWTFILLQGIGGVFSTWITCLGMTILSDRDDPAREFGIAMAMQVASQIAAFSAGPTLLRISGLNGVLATLVVLSALAMLLAPKLPSHGSKGQVGKAAKGLLKPATALSFIGLGAFFVNAGAYWTYVELIGQAHGMTSRVVGNCVATAVSAGIVGGALAWKLGNRFGRLRPLCLSAVLTVLAALLLLKALGIVAFVVSGLLYCFSWNYSCAYQFAIISAVDDTGRGVAFSMVFCYLGAAVGAGLASVFVTPGDYHGVVWVVIVAVCCSTVLFALSTTLHKHLEERAAGQGGVNTKIRT
jgi:DHA1 family inner membrane transport protein